MNDEVSALHEALSHAASTNGALADEYEDLCVDLACGPEAFPRDPRPPEPAGWRYEI